MAKSQHIFEIQQIRIDGVRYPRRRVHLFSLGCFDTLAHGEEALQAFIADEKERRAEWGRAKDYYDNCMGYYVSQRQVHTRLPMSGDHVILWRSYTADGDLNDLSTVRYDEHFHGRKAEDIHFQVGDIVEVVTHGYAELVIVAGLPPSVEWVRQREEYVKERFHGRPFLLDDSDDCYLVYPMDGDEGNHYHVLCHNVFHPTRKVPQNIIGKLRARLNKTIKKGSVKTIDTTVLSEDTKSLGGKQEKH